MPLKKSTYDAKSLNGGSENNQVAWLRRINRLLKTHPAFSDHTDIRMIQGGDANALVFLRHHRPSGKKLLVLVNLDHENPATIAWHPGDAGLHETVYTDLLSDQIINVDPQDKNVYALTLPPGQVYCLTAETEIPDLENAPTMPRRIVRQRLRATALEVFRAFLGTRHLADFDPDAEADHLAADPMAFCRRLNPDGDEARVIQWQWPTDTRRHVMLPPGHFLMITVPMPFRASIVENVNKEEKTCAVADYLSRTDGGYFALFPPLPAKGAHIHRRLKLSVFDGNGYMHAESGLLYLTTADQTSARQIFNRQQLKQEQLRFLGTNGRGAMMHVHSAWSHITSKYDGLLAANLNPHYPDDRHMMLIRCRAWLVFQGYSQDMAIECQQQFRIESPLACTWRFTIPCGQGQHVTILFTARMTANVNQVGFKVQRLAANTKSDRLPDDKPVRLIIRPDIDDRNFHTNTKAYMGPEHQWPGSCHTCDRGFQFAPGTGRKLIMQSTAGEFILEPEWQYMVYLPVEADRSMDPHTDLFSPGYFSFYLTGNQSTHLTATASTGTEQTAPKSPSKKEIDLKQPPTKEISFETALKNALKAYIVRRGRLHTIIAGYPWFLDWGRDTLIVIRGLISAGYLKEAETILMQFASFEENGTLPNMIRGNDASNRDTSDAPLWFFVACEDLMKAAGNYEFLEKPCGERRIIQVLTSIANGYINGTPNGIIMDDESGLIYSPSHFTWMDTNHPAGSPRQGYPVEIQALWHFALRLLARFDKKSGDWDGLAEKARDSIEKLFILNSHGFLSDCLHAEYGTPAGQAEPDDALRPNQLFAVTLGAVSGMKIVRSMLDNCMELLVPGAIRSLADRPVKQPLAIWHHGKYLNDPYHPYQGAYTGDEDTRRKPAYHNGTAWTWVFPSFCEAWAMAYKEGGADTALTWLSSSSILLNAGCAGQIPEILDGDAPHTERGCDAQAWGVSELLRVWRKLTYDKKGVNK